MVKVINNSSEPKVLPPGTYTDTTIDLSDFPGLGPLRPVARVTTAYQDQKPGTSGLRKKTKAFQQPHYLHNFVQATFNALEANGVDLGDGALVLGGDGRFFNDTAIQVILKMAFANGVRRVVVGQRGLLSTPAVSAIIREKGPDWQRAYGAFILTASHNPGGPDEDFGIKYNCENGGPAPEKLTDAIYEITRTIKQVKICDSFPDIDLSQLGSTVVRSADGFSSVVVDVISSTEHHVSLLKSIFDFDAIRRLFKRPDFSMTFDCMHGVQGPYAQAVLVDELGAPSSWLINNVPKDDFNGGHADPNLTYARDLCEIMGVDKAGLPQQTSNMPPCFGAASDGDADRNMILGKLALCTVRLYPTETKILPYSPCRPQLLRDSLRLAGDPGRPRGPDPLFRAAGRPPQRGALHAHLRRCGPGGRPPQPAPVRDPHRLEVLRQRHGQQDHLRGAELQPHDLRRGELRHRLEPRPREGRHVGRAGLAVHPGALQPQPRSERRL